MGRFISGSFFSGKGLECPVEFGDSVFPGKPAHGGRQFPAKRGPGFHDRWSAGPVWLPGPFSLCKGSTPMRRREGFQDRRERGAPGAGSRGPRPLPWKARNSPEWPYSPQWPPASAICGIRPGKAHIPHGPGGFPAGHGPMRTRAVSCRCFPPSRATRKSRPWSIRLWRAVKNRGRFFVIGPAMVPDNQGRCFPAMGRGTGRWSVNGRIKHSGFLSDFCGNPAGPAVGPLVQKCGNRVEKPVHVKGLS